MNHILFRQRLTLSLILLFPILGVLFSSCSGAGTQEGNNIPDFKSEVFKKLNHTIAHSEDFRGHKIHKTDSIRALISQSSDSIFKCRLYIELADIYRPFDPDSAIIFARSALASPAASFNDSLRVSSSLALASALSTSGMFSEAEKILEDIDYNSLTHPLKIDFWKASRLFNSYSMAFLNNKVGYADKYRLKYYESDDSLLVMLPSTDPFRKFVYAEKLVRERNLNEAKAELTRLMKENPLESNIFGMSAYQLAEVCRNEGDMNGYAEYLALAADSDLHGGIREGLALPTLAVFMYEMGDLKDAFTYINHALDETTQANTRMRIASVAESMSVIDRAYKQRLDETGNAMIVAFVVVLALFFGAILLLVFLIRNVQKSKTNEKNLAVTSKKLQDYVGNFISLCSNYSVRLEQLGKLVERKINSGQSDDLLKLISSGRFADEDNAEFYKLIDKAILDIYPDFIPHINTLLQPDKHITASSGDESLNPELRIYACVRLGVDQSSRIAQILHYSVNTVYTYRNRMRNRAINRDTFDRDVMNLGNPILGEI